MTKHENWEIENVISDGEYLADNIEHIDKLSEFAILRKSAQNIWT